MVIRGFDSDGREFISDGGIEFDEGKLRCEPICRDGKFSGWCMITVDGEYVTNTPPFGRLEISLR
jgi:hypothetical protein